MRLIFFCSVASLNVLCSLCSALDLDVIHGALVNSDITVLYHPPSKLNYTRPDLIRRQQAGRCGPDFGGGICSNDQCCSFFGYCGLGQDHCSQIASCQPAYGYCEGEPLPTPSTTSLLPTPTPTLAPTPTSSTASTTSTTSNTSATTSSLIPPPPTTSSTTRTTSSSSIVVLSTTSSTSILPPLPTGTLVSTNGMCGNSTVCTGSGFGQCCSGYWYCGDSAEYCGVGCNPIYGSCGPIISTSATVVIPPTTSSTIVILPPTTSSTTIVLPPTTSTTSSTIIVLPPTPSTTSITSTTSSFSIPPVIPTTTSTSRSTSSTQAPPTPTPTPGGLPTTSDGTCGNGFSCNGWANGPCCSRFGYCGGDYLYCRQLLGCQLAFGTCDPT